MCLLHPFHVRAMQATRAHVCTHGSTHTSNCNQFLDVVDLPKDVIMKLKLSIEIKPMNMRSKLLTEAKLVEQINKFFIAGMKVVTLAS